MNEILLIVYINIGNMNPNDIHKHIDRIAGMLREGNPDGVHSYLIPIREGETRVECVNPKMVSESDYADAKKALDDMIERVSKLGLDT